MLNLSDALFTLCGVYLIVIFPGGGPVHSSVHRLVDEAPPAGGEAAGGGAGRRVGGDRHHVVRHEVEPHREQRHQARHQQQHHRVLLQFERTAGNKSMRSKLFWFSKYFFNI